MQIIDAACQIDAARQSLSNVDAARQILSEPRWNRFCVQQPFPKQGVFLSLEKLGVEEALYGGAAGGGKSSTLLLAAAQYVDVPGYAALLLRRYLIGVSLSPCAAWNSAQSAAMRSSVSGAKSSGP